MQTFFKILALVFTVLFMAAAYLQFNDSDPFLWILAYTLAAMGSLAFAFKKLPFLVAVIFFAGYFIFGFSRWPVAHVKKVGLTNIQEGREALGLLICGLIFMIYAMRMYYEKIKLPRQ